LPDRPAGVSRENLVTANAIAGEALVDLDARANAALAGLTAKYGLGARQREQLGVLLQVLARDERAPTTVRSPERAVNVHVADSLVALELELVRSAATIVDLGAGAGFPGLALAVAVAADVRLVESQARKCAFLEDVIATAGLENARAVCVRVEDWSEGLGGHDIAVARALAAQPVVLEYAAPLLRLGGALVDWRGRRAQDDEQAALRAAEALGLHRLEIRRVEPFEGAKDRHLHVYLKVRDTPERFPRRAGIARKRPLGRKAR
jgi:16S rRNA (guanine527-N7)-methyltransferase